MVLIPIVLYFYDINDLLVPENLGPTYYLISYGFPFVAFVLFWKYRSATPGKIWMDLTIVDADTLGNPTLIRLVMRYLGYYLSTILFLLGFIWIAFDKRKQGLHDKIANTLVIKKSSAVLNSADYVQKQLGEQGTYAVKPNPQAANDPWKE
jgi:uncharacterized RDD family membrane protein YckC